MSERPKNERLQKLFDEGKQVYSISKLNAFEQCEYSYYLSYIHNNKGSNNVYAIAGGKLHDTIQDIYEKKLDKSAIIDIIDDALIELDMLDINFPSESIKDSWVKDIRHFCTNFKVMDGEYACEEFILFEVIPDVWLQGYIDAQKLNDKSVEIYDWKSSSKFAKKDLLKYGRQLVVYTLGIEAEGKSVDKTGWYMLKYCDVCSMQKNGKIKRKMCNRGKWVGEIQDALIKEMKELGHNDFEAELYIKKAVDDNNLSSLPKSVQDKYWLEDGFVEYEVTDELKDELRSYVEKLATEINSKNKNNELDWSPIAIDKANSFFCSVLCNHRKTCKYLRNYLSTIDVPVNEKKSELEELFG